MIKYGRRLTLTCFKAYQDRLSRGIKHLSPDMSGEICENQNFPSKSFKDKQQKADPTSKRSQRKKLRFEKLKELKRQRQAEGGIVNNPNPGFTTDLFNLTEYYFENGFRKVYPYYFAFSSYVKGRWVNRTAIEVLEREFASLSKEEYMTSIRNGQLTVNGEVVGADYVLQPHDMVAHVLHRHENPVSDQEIEIIADTDDVVVINKPASIPCHPCGRYRFNSIPFILGKEMGYTNLRSAYRLDRLTSGVLILPKNAAKTKQIVSAINDKTAVKEYLARVEGEFPSGQIVCEEPIKALNNKLGIQGIFPEAAGGKPSKTVFERLSYNGKSSVVKCIPMTGRTHQIRVHLQFLGHPIVNDPLYNSLAFGPSKGKGGIYHRPIKDICQEITMLHNVGLWAEDEDNPLFHEKINAAAAANTDASGNSKDIKCSNNNSSSDQSSSMATCELVENIEQGTEETTTSEKGRHSLESEPESKKLKTNDCDSSSASAEVSSDLVSAGSKHSCVHSEDIDTGNSEVPSNSRCSRSRPGFDKNKWTPDKDCSLCRALFIEPSPKDMVLFLHALRYKGPGFDYSTSTPDWAREDWS